MTRRIFIIVLMVVLAELANAQTFVISPPDSFVFDCNRGTEYVTFLTVDFDIDTEELTLSCNGEVFDTSSERFSEVFLGVQFELPLEIYMPNDTINLCLHNLTDSTGEWYYDSICWQYYMEFDNSPPSFEILTSTISGLVSPGDTVSLVKHFVFYIPDSSGIDPNSIWISIEDSVFENCSTRNMGFRNDTLAFFNSSVECLHFAEGDSMIDICIHVEDLFEPCPNTLDTCFQLYLAPRDYCPCKAGFYMARWNSIASDLHTPVDMVIDSLSVKFEYFKLDDEYDVFDPCSMDVYYIQPWNRHSLEDSTIEKIHDYVYNGGILYLWTECTDIYPDVKELLQRDDEWFLGMEPRATHVTDSIGYDAPIIEFTDHPIVPEIDISSSKNSRY